MRLSRLAIGLGFLALGVGAGRVFWPEAPLAPVEASAPAEGPIAFALTDQHGRAFDAEALRGHAALVFFGYTFCPDVCPTTLFEMKRVRELLGDDAARYRGVFITVDPERDTPERLRAYLAHFDAELIGLLGTPAQLREAARGFGAVFERGESLEGGGYLMGHTAFGHLLDVDGRLHTVFPSGASAEEIATGIRALLAQR